MLLYLTFFSFVCHFFSLANWIIFFSLWKSSFFTHSLDDIIVMSSQDLSLTSKFLWNYTLAIISNVCFISLEFLIKFQLYLHFFWHLCTIILFLNLTTYFFYDFTLTKFWFFWWIHNFPLMTQFFFFKTKAYIFSKLHLCIWILKEVFIFVKSPIFLEFFFFHVLRNYNIIKYIFKVKQDIYTINLFIKQMKYNLCSYVSQLETKEQKHTGK